MQDLTLKPIADRTIEFRKKRVVVPDCGEQGLRPCTPFFKGQKNKRAKRYSIVLTRRRPKPSLL